MKKLNQLNKSKKCEGLETKVPTKLTELEREQLESIKGGKKSFLSRVKVRISKEITSGSYC